MLVRSAGVYPSLAMIKDENRAIPLQQDFAQPFAAQFACRGYPDDVMDGARIVAGATMFASCHYGLLV